MNNDKDVEELARLMWASWGGSDPDNSWKELDEPYKFKWKSQAELLIDNGYRKHSPESSGLDLNNSKSCSHTNCTELDNRYWWCKDCGALRNDKYDWGLPNNSYKFGTQPSKLVPLKDVINHLNLSHDRMLYARDYFENRMKNFPDNELGKTLSSIEEINKALELLSKLGSSSVPSVDDIAKEAYDAIRDKEILSMPLRNVIDFKPVCKIIAQSIHRLMVNGGKK